MLPCRKFFIITSVVTAVHFFIQWLMYQLKVFVLSNTYVGVVLLIMTVLAKTCLVCTKTEFNFIAAAYRHTQYLSIPSVSSVKC